METVTLGRFRPASPSKECVTGDLLAYVEKPDYTRFLGTRGHPERVVRPFLWLEIRTMFAPVLAVRTSWIGLIFLLGAVFVLWFAYRAAADFIVWFNEEILDDFRRNKSDKK